MLSRHFNHSSEEKLTRKKGNPRRALLLVPIWHLAKSPSVISSAICLAESGYDVDILTYTNPEFPFEGFSQPEIHVSYITSTGRWGPFGTTFLKYLLTALALYLPCAHSVILGFEQRGLAAATFIAFLKHVPMVYFSLEIRLLSDARSRRERWLKAVEIWCQRRSLLTVIQDERRAQTLMEENKAQGLQFVLVPNSPLATAAPRRTRYLHDKYALDVNQIVVLMAGSVGNWTMCREIAEAAVAGWPDNWTLVIHGLPSPDPGSEECYDRLVTLADGKRMILSKGFLSWTELDLLVSSAHVGLALYTRPTGFSLNMYHMASGKIMQYLKCGVPVVAIDTPNVREIVVDNQCGECVADQWGIKASVERILAQHEVYRQNAWKAFSQKYDFRAHFQRVIEEIETCPKDSAVSDAS
jgi:glycosyltransferase involved in cell wall biosynthesis